MGFPGFCFKGCNAFKRLNSWAHHLGGCSARMGSEIWGEIMKTIHLGDCETSCQTCRHNYHAQFLGDVCDVCAVTCLHLVDMSIEELADMSCADCLCGSMAEDICPTHYQDNEPICLECCACHSDGFNVLEDL